MHQLHNVVPCRAKLHIKKGKGDKMATQSEIIGCVLAWNVQDGRGEVQLMFVGGGSAKYPVSSLSELSGWAALVNEKPLYFSNGWVHTGQEPVGG